MANLGQPPHAGKLPGPTQEVSAYADLKEEDNTRGKHKPIPNYRGTSLAQPALGGETGGL
jgi:hypothetical protein